MGSNPSARCPKDGSACSLVTCEVKKLKKIILPFLSGSGELLVDRGEAVLHTVHIHRVGPYQVIIKINKNKILKTMRNIIEWKKIIVSFRCRCISIGNKLYCMSNKCA